MILFNLISMFNQYIHKSKLGLLDQTFSLYDNKRNQSKVFISKNHYINSKPYLFSISTSKKNEKSYNVSQNFVNQKFISRSFFNKLINQYWQETIFLSVSNPLLDMHINQLKADGISTGKNQYKQFFLDFSRALLTGRIEASLEVSKNIAEIQPDNSIKYIWRKGLNFNWPQKFLHNKCDNFPSSLQLKLLHKLQKNELPLFILVNGFNQIILAEPSEEILYSYNFLDKIYQWYCNNFLWRKHNKPIYQGLFFISSSDAIEYKNYIESKYSVSSKENHIRVFVSKLDFFYSLTRIFIPRVQFRVIPDLKELGDLIFKYRNYKHIYFHNDQKYGKNYFQGQPIYFIQPLFAFNNKTKKVDLVNYSYEIKYDKLNQHYETIFTNYQTAIFAWQKFRDTMYYYNLPKKPKIMVYNLEDFIKTCEKNDQIDFRNIIFIPSKQSYQFIKKQKIEKSKIKILQILSNKFLYLQVLSKRILWSLSSRQPMNW